MPPSDLATAAQQGVVVTCANPGTRYASEHERITQLAYARRLAALKGYADRGPYDPSARYPGHVYFVPAGTLRAQEAAALGIRGPQDLFGGVVPHGFVATKAITHPLLEPDAAALPGWNTAFHGQLGDAVLAGYSAFSLDDALRAGMRLLAGGPVRIKQVRASGGLGQWVARDAAELKRRLDAVDPAEVLSHGIVLEENLDQVRTFSVGQVQVGAMTASYFGSQRLTRNNHGDEVYGGSDLTVSRGDFGALLALQIEPQIRHAIEQARRYDAAVKGCFSGFFASRINYDVLVGRDESGRDRSGVLEQSWRVGGATGPELAALDAFRNQPGCERICATGFEIFGECPEPPPDAVVYFRGEDPRVGRLTKYTLVEPHVDAR